MAQWLQWKDRNNSCLHEVYSLTAKVDVEVSPSIVNIINSRVPCLHVSDEPKLVLGVRKTSWFLFHLHGWHQFVSNPINIISFILKMDYTSIPSPIQIAFESLRNLAPSYPLTCFSGHWILVRRTRIPYYSMDMSYFLQSQQTSLWHYHLCPWPTHSFFPSLKPGENEYLMSWAWMANHIATLCLVYLLQLQVYLLDL